MIEQNISYYLRQAHDHRLDKDFDPAIMLLKQASELSPNNAQIYLELARVYREKKEYDAAMENLTKAIELDSSSQEVHLELGIVYREKKEYDPALRELEFAIKGSAFNAQIYLELARAYRETNKYDMAITKIKNLLEYGIDTDEVRLELGRAYFQKGESERALNEFKESLKINGNNVQAHLQLAMLHRAKRNYESAITGLKEAVSNGLNNEDIHIELGRIYSEIAEYGLAEKEFQAALSINPKNGTANSELAYVFEKRGRYERALEELKEALRKGFNKDCIEMHLRRINHKRQVVEEFENFITFEYNSDKSNPAIMTEYIFQEGYDTFIRRLREATKVNPECLRAYIELAWIYIWHKQREQAVRELKKIAGLISGDKQIHLELIMNYINKNDYDMAISEYEQIFSVLSSLNNQNTNLEEEIVLTLKGLFPDKINEIETLLSNLTKIDNLYRWRYPAITRTEGTILYLLARLLKPEIIFEAGTWMGTSTSYLARACYDNKKGKVITVDKQYKDVGSAIPDELLAHIEFYKNVDIRDILPAICKKEHKIDMFFHDSNNSHDLLQWEIKEISPFITRGGLVIVHDILNSSDSPDGDVCSFFNEVRDKAKCYFFKTAKGIGVISDFEELLT